MMLKRAPPIMIYDHDVIINHISREPRSHHLCYHHHDDDANDYKMNKLR